MFNWIPSQLADIPGLYEGMSLGLWYIAVIIQTFFCGFVYFRARKIVEIPTMGKLLKAYAWFCGMMALNRIFFIACFKTPYYNIFVGLGYLCAALGFFGLILTIEHYILKKTKYFFSIISGIVVGMGLVGIFLPDQLATIRTLMQGFALVPGAIWFILYFWKMIKNTGEARKRTILAICSMIVAIIGYTLDSDLFYNLRIFPVELAPILYNIGIILFALVIIKRMDWDEWLVFYSL